MTVIDLIMCRLSWGRGEWGVEYSFTEDEGNSQLPGFVS